MQDKIVAIRRAALMMGPDVNPRENFMLALKHKEPYWLPCPLLDGSVVTIQHGLAERCDHGKDSWGVQWELKDLRSDSFPVNHPIDSPEMVEDYPFPVRSMTSRRQLMRSIVC